MTSHGSQGEVLVAQLLRYEGWTILERQSLAHGHRLDILAKHPAREETLFEVKVWADPTKVGTDTVKKAIADAWYLSTCPMPRPYLLFTSHLPASGVAKRMLVRALEEKIVAGVVTPWGDELFIEEQA